jgi:pimeloyl-ACP methyl ester carboxylesterase
MNGSDRTQVVAVAPDRPRLLRLAVLITATALLTLPLRPLTARAGGGKAVDPKPTIVLVHGAFAGPSSWDEVVAGLQKDGYSTVTPTLDLASVSGDVAVVRATLDGITGEKILVGHSYGGFVISNPAFGRSDVLGLVYTAGYVPDEGDSIVSLSEGYAPPAFLAPGHLVFDPFPFAIIDPAFFREDFAQDLNPKLAATLAAAQRPVSLEILFTPSGPVAWRELPSWYAVSGADRVIDPALQRWMAQRAGATVVEFDDASHAGGFTHYDSRFVKLIEQAVQATSG